jgi:hypothetical protein
VLLIVFKIETRELKRLSTMKILDSVLSLFFCLSLPLLVQSQSIVDLAVDTEDLSTLVDLVTAAGLVDTLAGPGNFTVFAPTNAAIGALPAEVVESLTDPNNVDDLTDVLLYHGA